MTNAFGVELHSESVRWAAAEGVSETVITILAENGTTTARLMAIYDWSTPGQAEVYIRAANRIAAGGAAIAHEVDRAGILFCRTCQSPRFVAPQLNQRVGWQEWRDSIFPALSNHYVRVGHFWRPSIAVCPGTSAPLELTRPD